MKIIFALILNLFIFHRCAFAQQEMLMAPATEAIETHAYIFLIAGQLRKDVSFDPGKVYSAKDSLQLFIADSLKFHKWNAMHHDKTPHCCQNRFYKFGFVNSDKEVIVPFQYDLLQLAYDSFLLAKKDNSTGIIDNRGNIAIPFKKGLFYFHDNKLAAFKDAGPDSTISFFDMKGKLLFSVFGSGARRIGKEYIAISGPKGRFRGILDDKGKWVVKQGMYDYVDWINDDFICVVNSGLKAVVNHDHKIILPFEYVNISATDSKQFIVYKDGMSGVIDAKNKVIIPLDSNSIESFGAIYKVGPYRSASGLYDAKGISILPARYHINIPESFRDEDFKSIHPKRAITVKDLSTGLLGLQLLPVAYQYVDYNPAYKAIITKQWPKARPDSAVFMAINLDGKTIVRASANQFRFVSRSPDIILSTNKENKSCFINARTGEAFTGYEYEYISYENMLDDGYFAAKKNWLHALVSPEGKLLTDAVYDRFHPATKKNRALFSEEIVCTGVKNNKLYGITKTGKEIPAN